MFAGAELHSLEELVGSEDWLLGSVHEDPPARIVGIGQDQEAVGARGHRYFHTFRFVAYDLGHVC